MIGMVSYVKVTRLKCFVFWPNTNQEQWKDAYIYVSLMWLTLNQQPLGKARLCGWVSLNQSKALKANTEVSWGRNSVSSLPPWSLAWVSSLWVFPMDFGFKTAKPTLIWISRLPAHPANLTFASLTIVEMISQRKFASICTAYWFCFSGDSWLKQWLCLFIFFLILKETLFIEAHVC